MENDPFQDRQGKRRLNHIRAGWASPILGRIFCVLIHLVPNHWEDPDLGLGELFIWLLPLGHEGLDRDRDGRARRQALHPWQLPGVPSRSCARLGSARPRRLAEARSQPGIEPSEIERRGAGRSYDRTHSRPMLRSESLRTGEYSIRNRDLAKKYLIR